MPLDDNNRIAVWNGDNGGFSGKGKLAGFEFKFAVYPKDEEHKETRRPDYTIKIEWTNGEPTWAPF